MGDGIGDILTLLPAKATSMRERALHEAVVQYLAVALPPEVFFFHPLQNPRSKVQGAIFHRLGFRAGIPDLLILHDGRALFIELKAPRKHLSPIQRAVHRQLRDAGCDVFLARSITEVQMALELSGIKINAKVAA